MNSNLNWTRLSRVAAMLAGALTITGIAGSAGAAPRDPTAETATDTRPAARRETRYCVVLGATTGTRLRRRICKTRDQWIRDEGVDPVLNR